MVKIIPMSESSISNELPVDKDIEIFGPRDERLVVLGISDAISEPIAWSSDAVSPPVKKLLFLLIIFPDATADKYDLEISLCFAPKP